MGCRDSTACLGCRTRLRRIAQRAGSRPKPHQGRHHPRLKKYAPTAWYETNPFDVEPGIHPPFSFGKVKDEILQDGLKSVNFVRFLAGLPDDVTLDEGLTEMQQAGVILLAHIGGGLSHTPPRPETVPEDFYRLAYRSTSSSNLASGFPTIFSSIVNGYMRDNSGSNIFTVGHRRWILNPYMQKTMFGIAYNPASLYR